MALGIETMPAVTRKTIRHTALFLGLLPAVFLGGILVTDRFEAFDSDATLSVAQAWSQGLIQGFSLLNILLIPVAVAVWRLHSWARWAAYFWFPVLAANNIITELAHAGTVRDESWLQAALISALWLWGLYPQLASKQASYCFGASANA